MIKQSDEPIGLTNGSSENGQAPMAGIEYEPCVVSFIDVLGFRSLIDMRSAAEVHDVLDKLEKFTKPEKDEPPKSMKDVRLNSRTFAYSVSDAIVRVRPYDTQFEDGAFFCELYDLLLAQIALAGSGVFVRAGVTVGDAYVGLLGEGPVFGPAIIRAYEIESQEAIFPRVVIDDHAIEEHRTDRRLRSQNNTLEYEIEAVDSLLRTADDGTRFIDYLRSSRSEFEELSSYIDFLAQHSGHIRKGRTENIGKRVKRKYEWLARYHNGCVTELHEEAAASDDLHDMLYEEGLRVDAVSHIEALFVPDV